MDLIYRQAALDMIFSEPLYKPGLEKRDADEVVPVIYEKIKSLPSAQPMRKKGKWIPKDDGRYHCSSCDDTAPKGYRWNFCPNCGEDMRGERNE